MDKKALRGGYTCGVPGCYSNTKRRQGILFSQVSRDVSLREKWVNSIKRKDFIPGEQHRVCSRHFHGVKKQGTSDVPIIFPLLPQSEKDSKNTFATRTSSQKGRKMELKALADTVVEEVNILCGLVDCNEKERTDMKLENARMKPEIADMKPEIADMKPEIADMKQ